MGCKYSSTGANSPSGKYNNGSQAKSLRVPNKYEEAYVNQMVMLANALAAYEGGRCDIREARDLADQYMKSCGEIAASGAIDYERTRMLMEKRGLSEHSRQHLERLYVEIQDQTQLQMLNVHQHLPPPAASNPQNAVGWTLQHGQARPHLLTSPRPENQQATYPFDTPQTAGGRTLQHGQAHPNLLACPRPEHQQGTYSFDTPQKADGWTVHDESVNYYIGSIIEDRKRQEIREVPDSLFGWACRQWEDMGNSGSDGWNLHQEQVKVVEIRDRHEFRTWQRPS